MAKIKLDRHSIIEIQDLISENLLSDRQIAEKFNVNTRHINYIRNGKRWSDCYLCEEERNKQIKFSINVQLQETKSDIGTPAYRITI
jgi:hypothetical protein